MQATITTSALLSLIQGAELVEDDERIMIVGSVEADIDSAAFPNIALAGLLGSGAEIDSSTRARLGVVVNQLESMSKKNGAHLLSRLRDLTCEKVLLIMRGDEWNSKELLALGYQHLEQDKKRSSIDGRLYLHDPSRFHESREWNNSSNWANPENFNKYRW
jgi:hypothetical protein